MALRDTLLFFARFIQHPVRVSSLVPSSRALAREMVRDLQLTGGQAVVELGPGTGVFTDALLPLLPDPAAYLGIDNDPVFIRLLRQRYPQLRFVEGLAQELDEHLQKDNPGPIQAVISGLPFASMPETMQRDIITSLHAMMPPGSEFRTFQYAHIYRYKTATRFRRMMDSYFQPLATSRIVWTNVMPAMVLRWRKGS